MALFDLDRFRSLAFGGRTPDHPLHDVDDAAALVRGLPADDPLAALARLTSTAASMNATATFTPGRRARILMLLDDAARPLYRELGAFYLAPYGRPQEGRGGEPALLRALHDSAAEFANGFSIAVDSGLERSEWVEAHLARLLVRTLRWLDRRLALAYMLRIGVSQAIWEQLHARLRLAVSRKLHDTPLPAFEGVRFTTSAKREYVRALLLALAHPAALAPRDVELVYRIAARVASKARLSTNAQGAPFAVQPVGDERPMPASQLRATRGKPLFLETAPCVAQLKALRARDADRDPGEEDNLFGRGFTRRERNAMLDRLILYWGPQAPVRRTQRVAMSTTARVVSGFEAVVDTVPPLATARAGDAEAARRSLESRLDDTTGSLSRGKLRAARAGPVRVFDASAGGLGLAVHSEDAGWAVHGALVGIRIEPGKEWFVGVLRRIFAVDRELRLGVQIVAAHPRRVQLRPLLAKRGGRIDHTPRMAIVLAPQPRPFAGDEVLVEAGLAAQGSTFDAMLPAGPQRVRVTRMLEDSALFQRVVLDAA